LVLLSDLSKNDLLHPGAQSGAYRMTKYFQLGNTPVRSQEGTSAPSGGFFEIDLDIYFIERCNKLSVVALKQS